MAYGDFAIQVGDEVGIVRRSRTYGTLHTAKFGTVTKINGHGHIYVQVGDQELRFTRNGYAYKDENYGPNLIHAAQLRAEIEQEERRKKQARVAREIEQQMKNGWSYSGRFFVSQERINQLKDLVNELELLVDND
jgi:flagellar hook protein FlgE